MLTNRAHWMRYSVLAVAIPLVALSTGVSAFAAHRPRHHHHAQAAPIHQHHAHHRSHHGASQHRSRHGAIAVTRISSRSDLVRAAVAYRGTPYVYGGAGRGGFDCSGFTSYLYGRLGISLPHSARSQFEMGRRISRDAMKPGDLVFFHTVTPGISHVGMYIGNGRFIHASSRRNGGVRVNSLDEGYYQSAFRGARRLR